jgi:glycerol-3-phosphate acyltransferase PlsX
VLSGAEKSCLKYPNINFLIYGDETIISPLLDGYPTLKNIAKIIHTDQIIANDDKPSQAVRHGKDSSMGMAIAAVKNGEADGAISSGNTGALMAMSKLALRMLPGIDRPAIATSFPTIKGQCIMLDLGANVDCSTNHLYQFAIMGDAFARAVLELENPSVGLLNVGSEDMKGNDAVKGASTMLREGKLDINYFGHIEGDDITKGTVDVVVCDGFSGNISLKTAEGTVQMFSHYLKMAFNSSIMGKLGYLFAKSSLKLVSRKLDPRMHNGAMFLGLNGVIVKSHGGSDDIGFANAIDVAFELIAHKINEQITKEIEISHQANNGASQDDKTAVKEEETAEV